MLTEELTKKDNETKIKISVLENTISKKDIENNLLKENVKQLQGQISGLLIIAGNETRIRECDKQSYQNETNSLNT